MNNVELTEKYRKNLSAMGECLGWLSASIEILKEYSWNKDRYLPNAAKPILILIAPMQSHCVVEICKIYERESNVQSIWSVVNFHQTHYKSLKMDNKNKISKDDISNSLVLLESVGSDIASLIPYRNKLFAHSDKKYFSSPDLLRQEYPISPEVYIRPLEVACKIYTKHSYAVMGGAINTNTYAELAKFQIDRMIESLK